MFIEEESSIEYLTPCSVVVKRDMYNSEFFGDVSAISSQMGDRLSWEDILVSPTQCAGKYITYTCSLTVRYAMQSAAGFILPFSLI